MSFHGCIGSENVKEIALESVDALKRYLLQKRQIVLRNKIYIAFKFDHQKTNYSLYKNTL